MTELVTRRPRTFTLTGSALGGLTGMVVGATIGHLVLSLLVGAILGLLAAELLYNAATVPASQRRLVAMTTALILLSGLTLALLFATG